MVLFLFGRAKDGCCYMAMKKVRRIPRNYRGSLPTGRHIETLLPALLERVTKNYEERGDLIRAAWPNVVGERVASMTEAFSFQYGILKVNVRNSTLYSLLSKHEKSRLLTELRSLFPSVTIRDIFFRIK